MCRRCRRRGRAWRRALAVVAALAFLAASARRLLEVGALPLETPGETGQGDAGGEAEREEEPCCPEEELPQKLPGDCDPRAICVRGTHRLGNNLKALTRAFWVASNRSFCFVHLASVREDVEDFVTVPDEGLFRLFRTNRSFSPQKRGRCWGTCWTDICTLAGVKYPQPNLLRRSAQQFLLPHLRCNATELSTQTVVMHFRSGDILYGSSMLGRGRIRLKGHYPQPPCAFWLSVLRLGNNGGPFPEALILMEPGFEHPCLDVVVNGTSADVRVQSSKRVAHDACTMVAARHLAIGFGTWGVELGRLNKRLLSLHVPFADDGVRLWEYQSYHLKDWLRSDVVYEGGMPYAQHLYSFPGFYSNQTHYPEKRAALLRYEERDVVRRSIACACNSSAGGG